VGVSDWWRSRSRAFVVPAISRAEGIYRATALVSGATAPGTAIEIVIPGRASSVAVFLNGQPAAPSEYRLTRYGVKVRVGSAVTSVVVEYALQDGAAAAAKNDTYSTTVNAVLNEAAPGVLGNDTGPAGMTARLVSGPYHGALTLDPAGSFSYTPSADYAGTDSFTYAVNDGTTNSATATATITVASAGSAVLFLDDFTRVSLSPWTAVLGTWTLEDGVLLGSSSPFSYAVVRYDAPLWSDYSVEGQVRFPAGSFGGGLAGRVNLATGARYTAAVYPDGSAGGSNVLKLVKFRDWTTWNYTPMSEVGLTSVGTDPHALKMSFAGSRIRVYYDGALMIDVVDENFDSRAPYLTGGISVDLWTSMNPYAMGIDTVAVQVLP
jgi:hypothetical protein